MIDGDKIRTCPAPTPAINIKIISSTLCDLDVIVEIRPQDKDKRANPERIIVCFALIRLII